MTRSNNLIRLFNAIRWKKKNKIYPWTPTGNSNMKSIVAADFLVGIGSIPLIGLEKALALAGNNEVHDHGSAAGDRGLGSLVEVVH